MGGSDTSLYTGSLKYFPIITNSNLNPLGYWLFKMNGVFIQDIEQNLCGSQSCQAIADTGSSYIIAPTFQILSQIYTKLSADSSGIVACNKIFKLPSWTNF